MYCLKRNDLDEIRDMLENGLNLIYHINRIDKMNMRKRIRNEIEILGEFESPSTENIMGRFEERLPDVMQQLPYAHLDDLRKLIAIKTARFRSMSHVVSKYS